MSWELIVVLALTVLAVVLFVSEALRIDLVALLVMALLMVTGILTPEEGLRGFSNSATITIAAMFVLSEALRQTGLVRLLGDKLSQLFKQSYKKAMSAMMGGVGVLSAFINNTGVVAIFLPIMTGASRDARISATKVLMPLSFAAMFAGVCTLIGTSTNILVSSIMDDHGMAPIGMFEMAPLGLVFFGVGVVYMLTVGDRLMPERESDESLTESFEVAPFLTEIEIMPTAQSAYVACGKAKLCESQDIDILEVFRDGTSLGSPDPDLVFEPGDILRIRGSAEAIRDIERNVNLKIRPELELSDTELEAEESSLIEAVVAPDSVIDGKSLNEIDFAEQFTAYVLAIRREGELLHDNLLDEKLEAGDVLLLQTPTDKIAQLQRHSAFLVVSELGLPEYHREMLIPALIIVAAVVLTAAFELLPIVVSAVCGAVLLVVARIVSVKDAYEAINWQVIFLLAGILSLGVALEKTGGVDLIAEFITGTLGNWGPTAILAGFYVATTLLTSIMSNQATAILLAPVAIDAANALGLDPRPFALAITFAASASFITPIGYQTNTLVYGAGQYKFADFIKVGSPLTFIFAAIAVWLLPVFWPM
ncbi:TRAP transporter large permease subunit [Persicimonas caeni]|uniref:TRAP transporter large permease subunit n=1 Tax=Persicimonas caeni TaxID=2292766 RepID=A0A4Y6PYR4_PERCE|nr:SLC13 family permease [Persicimonas caeni]QDG52875.1 TRAP transporter large permease subunit [Persicimonas caeni]QED34097.1 TRAP transporter large permease subunit [Persicimonas caeni]